MGKVNKPDLGKIMSTMKKAQYKPLEPYKTALTKWKCLHIPCGNVVNPKYNSIQQGKGGCRTCRYIKSAKSNTLAEKEAVKRMLKAKLKPLVPYKNNNNKWKSICLKCYRTVYPTLSDISNGGGGCIKCGRISATIKQRIPNSEAVKIMLKANLKPLEPYTNLHHPWKSRCLNCKRTVHPNFATVKFQKGGCAYCSQNKIDVDDAKKAMIKAKLIPLEAFSLGRNRWKCKCMKCGKIVYPTYAAIRSGQGGCLTCGKREGASKNRLPEKEAIAIMMKSKLKPLEPYRNRNTAWKCKCLKCGAVVSPSLGTVMDGGLCIVCRPFGLNMTAPAYLYIISHTEFNSHKVGLGTVKKTDDRLTKFTKRGWIKYKTYHFKTGEEALKIEKSVFQVIRKDLKLPIHLTKKHMPITEGHTETVNADSITLLELEKIIKKVIRSGKVKS